MSFKHQPLWPEKHERESARIERLVNPRLPVNSGLDRDDVDENLRGAKLLGQLVREATRSSCGAFTPVRDEDAENGSALSAAPVGGSYRPRAYAKEAVGVIAALLRQTEPDNFQKLLADGLGYAPSLAHADLQRCNLQNAYLGVRADRAIDLSNADYSEADLSHASLRDARAREAVFYGATLKGTVFDGSDLTRANFRGADLEGVRFGNAILTEARFEHAQHIPPEVSAQLQDGRVQHSPVGQ